MVDELQDHFLFLLLAVMPLLLVELLATSSNALVPSSNALGMCHFLCLRTWSQPKAWSQSIHGR